MSLLEYSRQDDIVPLGGSLLAEYDALAPWLAPEKQAWLMQHVFGPRDADKVFVTADDIAAVKQVLLRTLKEA